ncbi:MAG: hypothetical protein SCALA702_30730 [Melioribacteraceae bacterium]|nr:MAG: hypothetical protein SCALA702_30730 [Melioribacteraceae bacterium]
MRKLLFVLAISLLSVTVVSCKNGDSHIRVSQVGYLKDDIKTGVVLSKLRLDNKKFEVIDVSTGKASLTGNLEKNKFEHTNFKFSYKFDFTRLDKQGKYIVKIGDAASYPFEIGDDFFADVVDTLMQFYKIQRCGYTNPEWHEVCHIADATSLIFNGRTLDKQVDVTGGWHDAADYIKFFNTTAYTTYLLLFAYEHDNQKFGFDLDKNGAPDILEEAKIGLDWLIRADYREKRFITQVQDLRDHEVGWRMPEDDPLAFDRPGFTGIGKNLIGIYSATMASAARVWKSRFGNEEYAAECLRRAEQKFSIINEVDDIDSSGTGMYLDNKWEGKAALGAIELYITTGDSKYLTDAKLLGNLANSDYWWSWGNINSLAHYKIALHDESFTKYIKNNLIHFNNTRNSNIFEEGAAYSWGTNNTLMGISLQVILYESLTGDNSFDSLLVSQRDYVLGKNPWGLSFIHGIGAKYSENFHHQVAHFMDGHLPGGFAAGPVTREFLDAYNIPFEGADQYIEFQTDSSYYRDDKMDYVSNEPTITANATAIFVMGHYSRR